MLPEVEHLDLHGHRVAFRRAGDGPLLLLIHGITGSLDTWDGVIEDFAENYTVIAPDLLGHGQSAKPQGDYSMGSYASGIRDLVGVLGYDRGTIVGHSLGGGIAMQFAYQFPEYCERLVLMSSGGLGREVNPLLRAATLPGSELVLPLLTNRYFLGAGETVASAAGKLGLQFGSDVAEFARGYASLADGDARHAFLHTLRNVIDIGGQRVSALDRIYLAEQIPLLLIWGDSDPVIPVQHGRAVLDVVPSARLVEIEDAGHFPQLDDSYRVATELADFIDTTAPYEWDLEAMRDQLRRGPATRA